ncbi:MobF family relaxase [Glutamicibacter uratoxydans]|uniref:MobF family relaxase n=1 Tax=Glutamicibacter uratoxydans TaxID=43667 RepID=UPI003D6E2160
MTVSISKMSIDYYLTTAAGGDGAVIGNARDLTSYYTESEDPPGTWFGTGLTGTGITHGQQVEKWAAKKLYEDMTDPYTGKKLGRPPIKEQKTPEGAKTPKGELAKNTRKPVHGFDLTFSAPKSVSTLWAMADPELQARIHQAHKDAIAETLTWAEKNVIQTRAGHGGVAHVPVTGIVGSLFDHSDSREGDPQLHSHAVIHNRVQRTSDGQWTTIDSYTLYRHVVAISERYNSLLYDRLFQTAGALAEVRDDHLNLTADMLTQAIDQHDHDTASAQYEPYNARVELVGIPDELIEEFSTRSRLIEHRTNELVAQWSGTTGQDTPPRHVLLRLRQQATLETRTPKDTSRPLSLTDKMTGWRDRVRDLHYDPAQLVRQATGHDAPVITATMLTNTAVERLGHWVLTDAGMRRSTFTRANLLAGTERILRAVRCTSATDREELANRIVEAALSQAVNLTPTRTKTPRMGIDPAVTHRGHSIFEHRPHAGLYTTHQVIDDENFLMSRTDTDTAALSTAEIGDKLGYLRTKDGYALSADQQAAATQVLTSGRALEAIIGPAGTGKTTTMKAIRDLWAAKYGTGSVIGLAPSAVAAGVLGDELDSPTDNTAKWIYESVGDGAARRVARMHQKQAELDTLNHRLGQATGAYKARLLRQIDAVTTKLAADYATHANYSMKPNQLVIIDEASMVGTATLAELNRQAANAGAKVLLVGDPRQLDSIDAGGFLGWMEREKSPAILNQVWRFRDWGTAPSPEHWEAKASLKLRIGDEKVLATYDNEGRLIGEQGVDAADTAYRAWIIDTLNGAESLMIGATNDQVHGLNAKAQLDLVDAGHVNLETVVTLREGAEAGLGDVILARKNNRNLRDSDGAFIANGVRIRITHINTDGSAMGHRTDTDATISLDKEYLAESVELGYASTAHRAQGVTVDTCHTIADSGVPRELFYVAMTRGKYGNYAYVNIPDDQDDTPDHWNIMKKIQPEAKLEVLAGILRNETATKTAHVIQNAEHGWAKDYGRMAHEAIYLADVARSTRTIAWITKHYGEEQLTTLQSCEQWQSLVRADPAHTIKHAPQVEDITIAELLLHVQEPQQATPRIGAIVPDYAPGSGPQAELKVDLTRRMDDRLDEMTRQALFENPDWVKTVKSQYPTVEYDAVRLHCAWRSVSDQDDATKPVGTIPDQQGYRYMHGFYTRFQTELRALRQNPRTPEPAHCSPQPGFGSPIMVKTATLSSTPQPFSTEGPTSEAGAWNQLPSGESWESLFTDGPPIGEETLDPLTPLRWSIKPPIHTREESLARTAPPVEVSRHQENPELK